MAGGGDDGVTAVAVAVTVMPPTSMRCDGGGGRDCCVCRGVDFSSMPRTLGATTIGCCDGVGGGGGSCAGAGSGAGRSGGVGAGTGELLVPLLNGRLGGKAPGNSCFRDAGAEPNITELASEPCNKEIFILNELNRFICLQV